MTDRLHPLSKEQLRQLLKLHGCAALLEELTKLAREDKFISAHQQFGLQEGRRRKP